MPTHVHLDHAGGVGALMQALPNAQLVIHPYGARHMIDPSKLVAGASAVYGEDEFASLYGELVPVDKDRVIEAADGFVLDFRGRRLEFIDTPGHARHHYCIVDEDSGGVFTGDTMGLGYPEFNDVHPLVFPTTTPVQFDPEALHASVDRIMSYKPQWLYLTHFGRVGDTEVIARQLHEDIDKFVSIAGDTGSDENALEGRLMAYMLDRVTDNGCTLERETIRQLLQGDITLNAQGISIWIDKP
jgi:glyoxylase-like metal-dependent hydrolase (beta-lactamase superfamily II)